MNRGSREDQDTHRGADILGPGGARGPPPRRAVAAHATGFVVRDVAPEFMAEAVRRVARGKKVIDCELAFAALNTVKSPLTAQERAALPLAAEGATTAEIASDLCLSVGTVRNYLSRVITKTGGR